MMFLQLRRAPFEQPLQAGMIAKIGYQKVIMSSASWVAIGGLPAR
jgi:hypothetical protein